MAILNYVPSLKTTLKNLQTTVEEKYLRPKEGSVSDSDKRSLIFTGDGHIITHGIDYYDIFKSAASDLNTTYTFTSGTNGSFSVTAKGAQAQVISIGKPATAGTADKVANTLTLQINGAEKVKFDGSSTQTFNITPDSLGALTSSSKIVWTQLSNVVADSNSLNSAERILTGLQIADLFTSKLTSAMNYKGAIPSSGLPPNPKLGDTYKATSITTLKDVYIDGVQKLELTIELGDTVICERAKTETTPASWNIIQNNINLSSAKINGGSANIYGTGDWSIYAPTSLGTAGQVLVTNNNAVAWASVEPSVNITNGAIKISVLGQDSTSIDIVAKKTLSTLSAGVGLTMGLNVTFDGETDRTINLLIASSSTLGGVLVNSVLQSTPAANSKYYAVDADKTGKLFVNVPWTDTTYTLSAATTSALGGIKLFADTDTSIDNVRSCAVKLSSNLQAYVNVPWILYEAGTGITMADKTGRSYVKTVNLSKATTDALGGIQVGNNLTINDGVLSARILVGATNKANGTAGYAPAPNLGQLDLFLRGDATWVDPKREIQVNGVSIGNNKLNFTVPDNCVALTSVEDGVTNLTFDLRWYNLATGEWETA